MKKDLLNSPSDNYPAPRAAATKSSNTTANANSLSGPDAMNYGQAPFLNHAVYNNSSRQQVQQSVQPPYNQTIAKKILADQKLAYGAMGIGASTSTAWATGGIGFGGDKVVATVSCGRIPPPPTKGGDPTS
jgi:hypothetical protein